MVVNRKKRRARVILECERTLVEYGELGIATLTFLVEGRVNYKLNAQQVALFIRKHPRIRKTGSRLHPAYTLETLNNL